LLRFGLKNGYSRGESTTFDAPISTTFSINFRNGEFESVVILNLFILSIHKPVPFSKHFSKVSK
jgi:hypothetical protein